jgi:hypothetical protein
MTCQGRSKWRRETRSKAGHMPGLLRRSVVVPRGVRDGALLNTRRDIRLFWLR